MELHHIGDLNGTIEPHLGQMVNTILEENLMLHIAREHSDCTPEIKMMQRYFEQVKHFPEQLVTHNNLRMQHAFVSVTQEVWMQRVLDLQQALQSFRNGEAARRRMVTQSPLPSVMTWLVEEVNDVFLLKYEEMMQHVLHNFQDFFPYSIEQATPQVMVFKKMGRFELIEYVMRKF